MKFMDGRTDGRTDVGTYVCLSVCMFYGLEKKDRITQEPPGLLTF